MPFGGLGSSSKFVASHEVWIRGLGLAESGGGQGCALYFLLIQRIAGVGSGGSMGRKEFRIAL